MQNNGIAENRPSAVLYQIAPDVNMLLNCYVIKTKNGKLIVIDGGGAGSPDSNGYLYGQLQKISGRKIPEIEAWILTHLHDDHVNEFIIIANDESKKIKVKNIYLNAPSRQFMQRAENGRFAYLYDDVKKAYDIFTESGAFDKIHGKSVFKGDVINIDGITLEILLTVSDECTEDNINDTSLIFRADIEGQTVLFLGDAYIPEGNRLLDEYGVGIKSDVVQMAHHGQNGVTRQVYETVEPKICLWPTPIWVYNNADGIYQTTLVRQWMTDMGVKYHYIASKGLIQTLSFPIDYSTLEENDISPNKN